MSLEIDPENLKDIVCLIKFITILDNSGNSLYGKYFNIQDANKQRDIEKRLCLNVKNLNIPLNEIDVFVLDNYNIFVKIIGEIAYFVAIDENDNECLAYNFCKILEYNMSNLLHDKFDRISFLEHYDKIVILIDEILSEGIIINTDSDSLDKLTINKEENGSQFISFANLESPKGGFFGSLFSGAKSIFG